MTKVNALTIKPESREEFFARGRDMAARLDKGKSLLAQCIISFEDENDMKKFLTENKLIT